VKHENPTSILDSGRLTERFRLQVRGEMFNVANHANFAVGSVGNDLTSPDSLGRANATPDVQAANPVIGSGGSRHIQLGAKIIWYGPERQKSDSRRCETRAYDAAHHAAELTEKTLGTVTSIGSAFLECRSPNCECAVNHRLPLRSASRTLFCF
jgi:hypothetical protein